MARNIPLRHELKFFINEMQYQVLSRQLDRVLWRDPNGDVNNEYHIRSLYFDTIFNDAYFDKMDGDQNRDKYRIRIYNMRDTNIKLECKTKVGSLISKRSLGIPRDLAEQIIACDPTGLEQTSYGLLSDLAKQGMAIIVVSSEIEEILGVCDSVVTIFEGKKTAQLEINDQLTREEVLTAALGGNFSEAFMAGKGELRDE